MDGRSVLVATKLLHSTILVLIVTDLARPSASPGTELEPNCNRFSRHCASNNVSRLVVACAQLFYPPSLINSHTRDSFFHYITVRQYWLAKLRLIILYRKLLLFWIEKKKKTKISLFFIIECQMLGVVNWS